jgi:hypothetical protein
MKKKADSHVGRDHKCNVNRYEYEGWKRMIMKKRKIRMRNDDGRRYSNSISIGWL